ncbi:MAG: hypothetical protein M3Q69_05910 [Acidobacteriota bacterium]|nr:hypothetical protein [Acidobacteriota bacterium]
MLETLTIDSFEPHVGSSFWAYPDPQNRVELRLVKVTKVMENAAAQLERTPFMLHFVGPGSLLLEQRTYRMEHEAFGPMPMFLVPVEGDAGGYLYEAIFT